ncbi:Unknown protein [Striga hermonthica]|uniref:Kinesin motor domain-containing protein n=1 Tax=Striga hermonthica TaxID=68872 RepID=A0A9N7P082_STRHE|nr:Unknown protein [Striga hermonthica]
MPFRTVEQPDFKEFIRDLQPRYKLPNRRKIAKEVWSLFCEEKAKIKSIIGDLRVSITTDTWTSIQNKLHGGRCLEEKLVEWGISKVFTITMDNASSNDVAVEYLKKQLRKYDSLMLDENLHMRCAFHIINLIVKDGMKELVESIEGIQNCVKYIHSSSARLDKFREFAVLEKKDKMSTIPMDVVTRWNATYTMLNSACKFKGVFARLVEEFRPFVTYFEEGRVGPPNDEDWEKAMGFAHFLKKFYDATIKLSATKTPTSHLVLKILMNLKVEIESKIRDRKNIVLENAATSMKRKFDKYWGSFEEMNILMFVAQTLDPRYKFQLMELQLGEIGYTLNEVDHIKSRVKAHLYLMYETYKGTSMEKSHVDVHEDNDDDVDHGSDDDDVELRIERRLNRQRKVAKLKEIANEVDKYFNDAYESTRNEDFDLLGWWKSKISSYSILSKVAKDVLAFPSSIVASENAFSLGGRIVDPFRASLTPRMVEALVCTNDWLRGEEFQFHKEPTEEELESTWNSNNWNKRKNEEEAAVYSADSAVRTPSTAVAASSTWTRCWTLRRERESEEVKVRRVTNGTRAILQSTLARFDLNSLRYTSTLSVTLVVVFLVITVGITVFKLINGTTLMPRLFPDVNNLTSFLNLFTIIHVLITAYIYHYNVGLAGSERVDKSEAVGERLKEAQHIKGYATMLMFVHINPDVNTLRETISTLKFAERIAMIDIGAVQYNKETNEIKTLNKRCSKKLDFPGLRGCKGGGSTAKLA